VIYDQARTGFARYGGSEIMDIGLPELLVILFVVVLIFGPGRLTNLGREIGRGLHDFRQELGSSEQKDEEPEADERK
jgi:sec-independent protein translocase protein TatA